jgi:hypothetical protein
MRADFTADGVQEGCAALIKAAIPVTCGQAMEVPEAMLKCMPFFTGDHAASIFNPGAVTSGYRRRKVKENIRWLQMKFLIIEAMRSRDPTSHTFKISGVSVFGPFEENAAT